MSRIRRRGRSICALIAALLLACVPASAAAQEPVEFTIADPRIFSSSGLTRDSGHEVYWTVNDSDRSGVVYAVGPDGETEGTLDFNTEPVDIQAVTVSGTRMYVADIGDKTASRSQVTVYWFDNPAPNDTRAGSYRAWDFTYPDGPHDAATLLVDRRGQLLFVTKESRGGIYQAPLALRGTQPNTLTKIADAPAYVTDGVTLPDGRLALRTYTTVEILNPDLFQPAARAALPFQPKGESLALSLDGRNLLAGSAGANAQVLQISVPTTLVDLPPGPATAPTPPPASASPVNGEFEDEGTNRTGTLLALLGALVAATVAAVIVAKTSSRGDDDDGDDQEETAILGRRSGSTAVTFDDDRTVIRPRHSAEDDSDHHDEPRELFRR